MSQLPSNVEVPQSPEKPMKSTVPVVPVLSLEHHLNDLIGSKKTCLLVSKFIKME